MDDEAQFKADCDLIAAALLAPGDASPTDEVKAAGIRVAIGFVRDFREINQKLSRLLTIGQEDES